MIARALVDAYLALFVAGGIVYAVWPWDWRGRRRQIVVKRDGRPFE